MLFAEPQYSTKAADIISSETGSKIYSLDPAVTGDAKPDGYDGYINVMEQNLETLVEALKLIISIAEHDASVSITRLLQYV